MKPITLASILAIAALGTGACAHTAEPAHPGHGADSARQLSLDQGRKWPTDEALRRHMGEVRTLLAAKSDVILAGRLTDTDSKLMGQAIEARVAAILTDCKLPPPADTNMHLVLADLVAASDVLQGRTKKAPAKGATMAVRASQMYATYFDHPGWRPVH